MGFRNTLITCGVLLFIASWPLGDWLIWLAAPLFFFGIVFKFLDVT